VIETEDYLKLFILSLLSPITWQSPVFMRRLSVVQGVRVDSNVVCCVCVIVVVVVVVWVDV